MPDKWTLPNYVDWMKCECGMIYGDNMDITQADYDKFYMTRYGFGVVDAEDTKRLVSRAQYIANNFDKRVKVLDFGGGESGLTKIINKFGFDHTYLYSLGDTLPPEVDVVIAEHVLEHIYDVDDAMRKIMKTLKHGGTLIVDVPDAGGMSFELPVEMPILDYHEVHINHFRMLDMLRLMDRYGFELVSTETYHERFGSSRMYVFIKDHDYVARKAHWYVIRNVAEKCNKLREIKQPVIVWGCGDIAMHCLSKVNLDIQYFVDMNPAFRGCFIRDIPVLDSVTSNDPIVVICQTQKQSVLNNIKALRLTNEVIVI